VSKRTPFEKINMTSDKNKYKIIGLLDDPISIKKEADSLKELAKEFPNHDEDKIVYYLESGVMLFLTPLEVRDWLSIDNNFIGGASIKTDGIWFWRDYFAYFILHPSKTRCIQSEYSNNLGEYFYGKRQNVDF
jgi:hypothetical protein